MQSNISNSNGRRIHARIIVPLVVLVIALVAAFLWMKSAQNVAQNRIRAQFDMQTIGDALKQYEQDYDGALPVYKDSATFETALSSYVPNTTDRHDPFIDLTNDKPFLPAVEISGKDVKKISDPASTPVLSQQPPYNRQLILYLDGHIVGGTPIRISP